MYLIYSFLLSLAFLFLSPFFLMNRQKYAAGMNERLGNYPPFIDDGRPVIWLHCVSVGETNAARPLVEQILKSFPRHRLIISTTTRTGQALARELFADKAQTVFYFPFDWKFTVRRALRHFKPSAILLMETEIWPRLIHEAKLAGIKTALVNGRVSQNSFQRYSRIQFFLRNAFKQIDLYLMQGQNDADNIKALGSPPEKIEITGNLKFDISAGEDEHELAEKLRERFGISPLRPLIIAASTHEPEEKMVLDAFCSAAASEQYPRPRLMIAPRHPERFSTVAKLANDFKNEPECEWRGYSTARRSAEPDAVDAKADIIILDSIGELRSAYHLATIVFVGGSLIPHGGQSILEPAAAGKAVITGPHTHNFKEAVRIFGEHDALVQLSGDTKEQLTDDLFMVISDLLEEPQKRKTLGENAAAVMKANRGATERTVILLSHLLS